MKRLGDAGMRDRQAATFDFHLVYQTDGNIAVYAKDQRDVWGVVGSVGQKFREISTAVGDVAACQQETERAAFAVGERVEFAVAAASADPDRLDERPPFPPPAERCGFICVLSIRTSAGGPPAAASVTNIYCQMPFAAHRTNRL